jgi:hypothetical protein
MAKTINVLHAYCPRIDLNRQATNERFIEAVTYRSTFCRGVVSGIQINMIETLISMLREGQSVDAGMAIFSPCVDLSGRINVNARVKKEILRALNVPGVFSGKVDNAESIGQPFSALIERWNTEHPDDPVE